MPGFTKTLVRVATLMVLVLGILVIAALLVLHFLFSGWDSPCGNQIIEEINSPGGRYRAVVFERDCGATTGFSTQVAIVPIHEPLGEHSNSLFVADTDHGAAPSGEGGGPQVLVRWRGDGIMEIRHDHRARVFRAERQGLGIALEYVQF